MHHAVFQSLATELNALRRTHQQRECWSARALMDFFRLEDWDGFEDQLEEAQAVCEKRGQEAPAHFFPVSVESEAVMDTPLMEPDILLSAYGGFLLAKRFDAHHIPVRFCLNYFPAPDRSWQALSLRMDEWERLTAREKLRHEERQFSGFVFKYFHDEEGMGLLKSSGDQALFGYSTREMKQRLDIPLNQPLADFLPAVTLRAKYYAEEKTVKALMSNPRRTEEELLQLYREANLEARQIMLKEWIRPEFLPPLDDIDQVETRFRQDLDRVARER